MVDLLGRVEVIPALATVFLAPRIPAEVQDLHASVREFDQVLLQGIDPEAIGDPVVLAGSVRALRVDVEMPVFLKETRRDAMVVERDIVEITQHGFRGRFLHGQLVVGAHPVCMLLLVTGQAACRPGKAGRLHHRLGHGWGGTIPAAGTQHHACKSGTQYMYDGEKSGASETRHAPGGAFLHICFVCHACLYRG